MRPRPKLGLFDLAETVSLHITQKTKQAFLDENSHKSWLLSLSYQPKV